MAADAIIFDVDGTLWDSTPFFSAILGDLASAPDEPLSKKLRQGKSIVTLVSQYGVSRLAFRRACVERSDELDLFEGIEETIAKLHASDMPLGIVTSLPGDTILIPLLEAKELLPLFGTVIHAGNCRPGKPNPKGLRTALNMLDARATKSVFYVGDRDVDQQTAANAGVSFAWASWGYQQEAPDGSAVLLRKVTEILAL